MPKKIRIDNKQIEQIAYEAAMWSKDAHELEDLQKKLKQKHVPFQKKFKKWIKARLKQAEETQKYIDNEKN